MIKYPLQSVEGVTEVLSLGGFEKQYQVRLDPDQLTSYRLSVSEVIAALESANRTAGAQFIEIGAEQYTVAVLALLARSTIFAKRPSERLMAGQSGSAILGKWKLEGASGSLATANGEGEAVAGLVLKLYGSNTSDVIENAKTRFDEINASLPAGVKAIYYDQGTLVRKAAATVTTALWQGALLVAIIVFAFLGGWRPSLVVVLSIPFSVGFAFIAMNLLGIGANLMTLGGVAIAIGMMVDGAIVIAENVDRGFKERPSGEDARTTVARASTEVIAPLIAAVAVVIIVFLPLFSLQGTEGKDVPSPRRVSCAGDDRVAFLCSVDCTSHGARSDAAFRQGRVRRRMAGRAVRQTACSLLCSPADGGDRPGVCVAARWRAVCDTARVRVHARTGGRRCPASGHDGTLDIADEAKATSTRIESRLLEAFPEIDSIVSRIGRGEVGAHADPVNSIEAFVALKPRSEWRDGMSPDELRTAISDNLGSFPGVRVNVGQPIAMSVDELLTGTKAQLAVKIFGPDSDVLLDGSQKLQSILQDVPGASDVQADQITGAPQLLYRSTG